MSTADRRAPHVVEEAPREPSRMAGGAPGLPEVADWLAVAVEDQRAIESACARPVVEEIAQLAAQHDHARTLVLAVHRPEPDDTTAEVDVRPGECCHLAFPPAGQVGEDRRIGEPGWEVRPERGEVGGLEEALAGVVLGQEGDVGPAGQFARADGEREHPPERRQLAVDAGWLHAELEASRGVGGDPVGGDVQGPIDAEHLTKLLDVAGGVPE